MNGNKKSGWQYIDKDWYYLDPSTYIMVIGWQKINERWYHFDNDGKMLIGWNELDKNWYYFDNKGKMLTGWNDIDKKKYYFDDDGKMVKGWKEMDGKKYYFDDTGAIVYGWKIIDGNKHFFDTDGHMIMNETRNDIDGQEYYFDSNGVAAVIEKQKNNQNNSKPKGTFAKRSAYASAINSILEVAYPTLEQWENSTDWGTKTQCAALLKSYGNTICDYCEAAYRIDQMTNNKAGMEEDEVFYIAGLSFISASNQM